MKMNKENYGEVLDLLSKLKHHLSDIFDPEIKERLARSEVEPYMVPHTEWLEGIEEYFKRFHHDLPRFLDEIEFRLERAMLTHRMLRRAMERFDKTDDKEEEK